MKEADYKPEDPVRFAEMLSDARRVDTKEKLQTFEMCWILSPEYPRQDICAVLNIVECERGWH